MAKPLDWETRIGRRVRLRDLHILFAVLQHGSMAKAAVPLGLTQSAVSQSIALLEQAIGVRLLERTAKGVAPTMYGSALVRRGRAAFDELRQGVKEIEFLADPTVGEVRIGCQESIAAAILPAVIQRFAKAHPSAVLRVQQLVATSELPALRERTLDMAVLRSPRPLTDGHFADDLNVEVLFHDQLVVAAGRHSHWARRRKIELKDLVAEPWILMQQDSWNYTQVAQGFLAQGLHPPKISLETQSTLLRVSLLAASSYIATFPSSVLRLYGDRFALKVLPVVLPIEPWPVVLVTLKNRILSPVVERFIEYVRDFTRPMQARYPASRR
jgi:DNA-binding transcriptional LysR family regulator